MNILLKKKAFAQALMDAGYPLLTVRQVAQVHRTLGLV